MAGCRHGSADAAEHDRLQSAVARPQSAHSTAAWLGETTPGCRLCPDRVYPTRVSTLALPQCCCRHVAVMLPPEHLSTRSLCPVPQALGLLALKLLVLGPLQLACAAVCRLSAEAAMSLLLLALCPVVSTCALCCMQ